MLKTDGIFSNEQVDLVSTAPPYKVRRKSGHFRADYDKLIKKTWRRWPCFVHRSWNLGSRAHFLFQRSVPWEDSSIKWCYWRKRSGTKTPFLWLIKRFWFTSRTKWTTSSIRLGQTCIISTWQSMRCISGMLVVGKSWNIYFGLSRRASVREPLSVEYKGFDRNSQLFLRGDRFPHRYSSRTIGQAPTKAKTYFTHEFDHPQVYQVQWYCALPIYGYICYSKSFPAGA